MSCSEPGILGVPTLVISFDQVKETVVCMFTIAPRDCTLVLSFIHSLTLCATSAIVRSDVLALKFFDR